MTSYMNQWTLSAYVNRNRIRRDSRNGDFSKFIFYRHVLTITFEADNLLRASGCIVLDPNESSFGM